MSAFKSAVRRVLTSPKSLLDNRGLRFPSRATRLLSKLYRPIRFHLEFLEPRMLLTAGADFGWSQFSVPPEVPDEHAHYARGTIPPGAIVGANGSFVVRRNAEAGSAQPAEVGLSESQIAAMLAIEQHLPGYQFSIDTFLGTPATLSNSSGFLSGKSTDSPADIAKQFMREHRAVLGLEPTDISDIAVSAQSTSSISQLSHVYLQQTYRGLDVFGAVANVSVMADGQILTVGNSFVPSVASSLNSLEPKISPTQAVEAAARNLGVTITQSLDSKRQDHDADRSVLLSDGGISRDPIPVKMTIVPMQRGEARLAWNAVINLRNDADWFEINVDAFTGEILGRFNWTDYDSYRVFPIPLESPVDGVGLPASHELILNPAVANASPFGWHDTDGAEGAEFFDTRGNNVNAQEDRDGNNTGGARPASLTNDYDFPFDDTLPPQDNVDQATVNLFYWNNIVHDVMALNGFGAAAGNFQFNNYGAGGLGADPVQADAQDAAAVGAVNNANFSTPRDGVSPRMQMFEFSRTNPRRDSDNDAGIIVHEYGHGISNRLVGGPANVFALEGIQSGGMGEGWSDWYALVFLAKPTDTATGSYPVGTYVLGQPATGAGIRRFPYSTNKTVNPLTYDDISDSQSDVPCPAGCSEVHNVGEVWTSVLWDMYWSFVNRYGFSTNLYTGTAGNNLALKLVTEAMKLTPASPTMLQARDGILAADLAMNGGANIQLIWAAFAGRGMGFSARDGGSHFSTNVVEAFDLPAVQDGSVEFDLAQYQIGDIVNVFVRDLDLTINSIISVNVTTSIGDTEPVTLSRVVTQPGVYRGSILIATGTPSADNRLQASIGGRIDVSYIDANDGAGGLNVMNSDTAQVGAPANNFERQAPQGGLFHVSRNNSGILSSATSQHGFYYFVESGQRISAVVTPTNPAATLTIQFAGSASVVAPAAGRVAVLPPTFAGSSGEQIIIVTSNIFTGYNLEIARNYIREITDSADGSELAIDSSLIDVGVTPTTVGTPRFGVVGTANPVLPRVIFARSNSPGSFIDISTTGTPLGLTDDGQALITTTVGNAFFPAGSVIVSNNGGIISGTTGSLSPFNDSLPTSLPNGTFLVPFWDDLDGGTGNGNVYWQQRQIDGINALIVQWHNRPRWSGIGAATFQLQLFASGPVYARFVYADVDFGDPAYNFGAEATIGYQRNSTSAVQFSFNSPSIANGDILELRDNVPTPDIDEYTLNLSGQVGKPIDVVLAGMNGQNFSPVSLVLMGPDGSLVATAVTDPVRPGVSVTNYARGILGYVVPVAGVYTIRVISSDTVGDYAVVVTGSLAFDTEPNLNLATDPLRSLDGNFGAIGSAAQGSTGTGLNFFGTRTTFNNAAPGLPVEDFEDGSAGQGAVVVCNAPMNSASNDACFTPGEILPGLEILDNPGPSNNGLVLLGRNVIGNSSIVTGPSSFAESTELRFPNNSVFAVGMDVFINTASRVAISIFGQNGSVLGTSFVDATLTGSFWGVTSDTAIARMTLVSTQGELVDNVTFGATVSGVDRYRISLNAGANISFSAKALFPHVLTTPINTLDPQLRLIHPNGTTIVASDLDSDGGRDSLLQFAVTTSGVYTIEVSAESGVGDYLLRRSADILPPSAISFRQKTPLTSPTNADQLIFLATFSEPVTGVSAADFSAVGTTGSISVTPIDASTYDVVVSGGDLAGLNGTVGLNLNAPTIFDLFGNALANSEPSIDEAYVVDNASPRAVDVIVSGSAWSNLFIDSIDGGGVGSGNGLGYSLNSGLVIPSNGIDRIYVLFSEAVVGFNASRIQLLGVNLASYANLITSVVFNGLRTRGEIQLSSPITRDRFRIGVADTVTDTALNALDGDSNGSAGGPVNVVFGILVGDANRDGSVNGGDLPAFAAAFNTSVGFAGYNPNADWNSDASVNGGDLPLFATNFNQSLPSSMPGLLSFGSGGGSGLLSALAPPVVSVDSVFGKWDDEEDQRIFAVAEDLLPRDDDLWLLDE